MDDEHVTGMVLLEAAGRALLGGEHSHPTAFWWFRRRGNNDSAQGKTHLLGLPAEIRNKIYHLAVVNDGPTIVGDFASPPPGLLHACYRIRREAAPIYYWKNNFLIAIQDYSIEPAKKWFSQCTHYRNLHGTPNNMHSFVRMGQPNWSNLVEWCRSVYSSEMAGVPMFLNPHDVEDTTLSAKHETVRRMRARPWGEVAVVLETFRNILTALKPQWAA